MRGFFYSECFYGFFTTPLLPKTIYSLCKLVSERRTGNNVEESIIFLIEVQPQKFSVTFKDHYENFTHYIWFPSLDSNQEHPERKPTDFLLHRLSRYRC